MLYPKPTLFTLCAFLVLMLCQTDPLKAQDTIPPVITLHGDSLVTIAVYETYVEEGISITDNVDIITSWDTDGNFYQNFPQAKTTRLGLYSIVYTARDKSNNESSETRWVMVIDTVPPRMHLRGDHLKCIHEGEDLIDEGVEFDDNELDSGDVAVTIDMCSGKLEFKMPGTYKFRYVATDKSANIAWSEWRYLVVKTTGDTSPCELKDSLRDTCFKATVGLMDNYAIKLNLKIYPNPADASLNIRLEGDRHDRYAIRLMNLAGQAVLSGQYTPQDACIKIGTGQLPVGIYFLEVNSSQGRAYEKVLIAR